MAQALSETVLPRFLISKLRDAYLLLSSVDLYLFDWSKNRPKRKIVLQGRNLQVLAPLQW